MTEPILRQSSNPSSSKPKKEKVTKEGLNISPWCLLLFILPETLYFLAALVNQGFSTFIQRHN